MDPTPATKTVEYVGFWARVLAFVIDSLLASLVLAPFARVLFGPASIDVEQPSAMSLLHALMHPGNLLTWLLFAVAVIVFWIYRSATPGKMVIGAVIVDADTHGKPTNLQLIGRYLAYYVSIIPFFLGFLWIGWDRRKQGWHDKLAGTVVVKKRSLTENLA